MTIKPHTNLRPADRTGKRLRHNLPDMDYISAKIPQVVKAKILADAASKGVSMSAFLSYMLCEIYDDKTVAMGK